MPTLPRESEIRRIILLRLSSSEHAEILLESEGSRFTLPQIRIARWQRIAEQLTTVFREAFGIDAISVSSIDGHSTESRFEPIAYEIMEPHGTQDEAPCHTHWVVVDSLLESRFHERSDFHAVRQAVAQSVSAGEGAFQGSFARLGWFRELEDWVQEETGAHGLHLSGRFRQLNASPSFSLIRFETEGPAVWFKAVGCPNLREFPLTLSLTRLHPRLLPRIIATRPEWNGWLALEAQGNALGGSCELGPWIVAARDLAELQIASLNRELHLLEAGARDLRPNVLAERVEPFFQMMGDLMERQIKIPPLPLSRAVIRGLALQVVDALALLHGTDFRATLGHLDLHPQNVIVSPVGAVFLDWAEGFLGHPFLTFQYLLEHFRRAFGEVHPQEAQLFDNYSSLWRAFLSDDDILRARKVAPLLAAFNYAAANEFWNIPGKFEQPRTAAFLRSLTRRMSREARPLSKWGLPCPR